MKIDSDSALAILVCVFICIHGSVHSALLGRTRPATKPMISMVNVLRGDIIRKLPHGYVEEEPLSQFSAVSFREQTRPGVNYYIKVSVGSGRYIHVKIHRNRNHVAKVMDVQIGKTLADPIWAF